MIGEHYSPDSDDMKGVVFTLYEIMTLDGHYSSVPHEDQDAEALMKKEWTKHPDVKVDADVSEFRELLREWVENRKVGEFVPRETWVRWQWLPEKAPLAQIVTRDKDGEFTGTEVAHVPTLSRRDLVEIGEPFFSWERPAGEPKANTASVDD